MMILTHFLCDELINSSNFFQFTTETPVAIPDLKKKLVKKKKKPKKFENIMKNSGFYEQIYLR